jgi:hypothetical protein
MSRHRRKFRLKLGLFALMTAVCSASVGTQEVEQVPRRSYYYLGQCHEEVNGAVTADAKCTIVVAMGTGTVSVAWLYTSDKPSTASSSGFSGTLTGTTFTVVSRPSAGESGGGTISAKEIDVTIKRLAGRPPNQRSFVLHYEGTFDKVVEPRTPAQVVR